MSVSVSTIARLKPPTKSVTAVVLVALVALFVHSDIISWDGHHSVIDRYRADAYQVAPASLQRSAPRRDRAGTTTRAPTALGMMAFSSSSLWSSRNPAAGGKDYYRILGVPRTAKEPEIKQAFRRLVKQYHPGKGINVH
jgi:hypothetical protein